MEKDELRPGVGIGGELRENCAIIRYRKLKVLIIFKTVDGTLIPTADKPLIIFSVNQR